jgi:hypothetical protein
MSLLILLFLFLNNDEHQAAIGALAVARGDRGAAGRAFALAYKLVGSADLGMHLHEVLLNALLRPLEVLRRHDQTAFVAAAAFRAARIGTDGARYAGVDENCIEFIHPVQITLPDHDFILDGLLHEPLLFLLCLLVLPGREEGSAAISAFFDVREVLGAAIGTYLIAVHSR